MFTHQSERDFNMTHNKVSRSVLAANPFPSTCLNFPLSCSHEFLDLHLLNKQPEVPPNSQLPAGQIFCAINEYFFFLCANLNISISKRRLLMMLRPASQITSPLFVHIKCAIKVPQPFAEAGGILH